MRTGVFCQEGVAYYRDCLGGLLLKRPGGGWKSLFESDSARKHLQQSLTSPVKSLLRAPSLSLTFPSKKRIYTATTRFRLEIILSDYLE